MIKSSLLSIGNKIKRNSKIVLYVRLKNLFSDNVNYKVQTENLLNMVREFLQPSEIYIPTFSYSFTKSKFFDISSTPSKVGRFSEEIRKSFNNKKYRTHDPVFSVIETEKGLFKDNKFNIDAFGPFSVWKYLNDHFHYIININLEIPIVSTQLHYLEYENKVEYRFTKYFEGTVKGWNKMKHNFQYKYYVRDLEKDSLWNRKKLYEICKNDKLLLENGPIKIYDGFKLSNLIREKLLEDKNFLIT